MAWKRSSLESEAKSIEKPRFIARFPWKPVVFGFQRLNAQVPQSFGRRPLLEFLVEFAEVTQQRLRQYLERTPYPGTPQHSSL